MATKYIVNNATGQTITSNITLTGSADYILSIRCENDYPWAFGVYNQTYNSGQTIFASWVGDDGQSYIGNEVDTQLNIYTNADYDNSGIGITSSGTTVKDDLTVNGNLIVSGDTNIRPYKVYTALLTQASDTAPVATVLENTLGSDITWSYIQTGYYLGTASNTFPINKIFCQGTVLTSEDGTNFRVITVTTDGTSIYVTSAYPISETPFDDILNNTPIEIRVYN